jgi:hypothetical protein
MKRLILTALLAPGLALAAMASARVSLPQPVYFWGSTVAAISVPQGAGPETNKRVIRPSVIIMFADGSWYVEHLHWTGWGSSVARATGISNASNGMPSQAQGMRITTPAQVTLWNPGRFQGHEVYRCFALSVPAYPASDQRLCLGRLGGYYWLVSTSKTPPSSGTGHHQPPASPKSTAPCTKKALSAGLRRGADPLPNATFGAPFGCAGGFAYSRGVTVGRDAIVVLFIAHSGRWETADRSKYCLSHQLPAKIYQGGCTTS